MPIYEYRRPDGSTFEVMQSIREEPLTHDPETGVEVRRVLHAPAVHFKGSGFYNTDYGTRRRQRESQAAGDGADGAKAGSADGASADGGSKGSDGEKASATGSSGDRSGSQAASTSGSGNGKAGAGAGAKSKSAVLDT